MRGSSAARTKRCWPALVAAAAVLLLSAPQALASRTASQRPELLASPALQPITATPALAPTYVPQGFALHLDVDPHPATFALFDDLAPASGRVEPEKLASGVASWELTPNLQRIQIFVTESRWCREFLGPIDSPNLYQAFGLDPMNMTDPLGLAQVPKCQDRPEAVGCIGPMPPRPQVPPASPSLPRTSVADSIDPAMVIPVMRGPLTPAEIQQQREIAEEQRELEIHRAEEAESIWQRWVERPNQFLALLGGGRGTPNRGAYARRVPGRQLPPPRINLLKGKPAPEPSTGSVSSAPHPPVGPSGASAIIPFYPPRGGFIGPTATAHLLPGTRIDRFGGSTYSEYFSAVGTPQAARSVPPATAAQPLRTFEVLKPLEVEAGLVAPAYGQPGFGVQYRTRVSLSVLLGRGFLIEVKH